jgi:class 3 adenylate cyclase
LERCGAAVACHVRFRTDGRPVGAYAIEWRHEKAVVRQASWLREDGDGYARTFPARPRPTTGSFGVALAGRTRPHSAREERHLGAADPPATRAPQNRRVEIAMFASRGQPENGCKLERRQGRSATRIRGRVHDLTVMFTDIQGFTQLAESLPPTLVARLLRSHFRLLARCIESEGGRIDKVMGDGLIAVWNDRGRPDDCSAALRAALAIRKGVEADNTGRVVRGQSAIRLRLGVHVGPLIATPLGPAGRLGVALCGDTVNVAQRLEDAARYVAADAAVAILASSAVVMRAGTGFRFAEVGELPVRGRRDPVLAYELGCAEHAAVL